MARSISTNNKIIDYKFNLESLPNGLKFSILLAENFKIKIESKNGYFMLISTINPINWNSENNLGYSDLFIINCKNEINIYSTNNEQIKTILIPNTLLSKNASQLINNGVDLLHNKSSIKKILNTMVTFKDKCLLEWGVHGIIVLIEDWEPYYNGKYSYDKIISKIEDNYLNKNYSLTNLAEETYISKRTIQLILNKKKTTFKKTLNNRRSIHMHKLINKNPNITLEDASYHSGFSSYQTAKRNFSTFYGITPKLYKKIEC
ncbi:hypothetical protein AB192_00995 [Aliivibrio fischeri]|nr:hypothetical protein AB192_00995 [Aliivibrio fischeri]